MTRAVSIPIIDLSTFFLDEELDQVEGKKKVAEKLKQACSELGLCQVVNHGVPINLINQALDLCKEFFDFPSEEKLKLYSELDDSFPLPHGYHKHNADKHETLFMHPPGTNDNVIPTNPPKFKFVIEELYTKFTETCQLLEGVLNDSLGLPPNFLKNYNNDRSEDCLFSYHYFPATESENNGVAAHQDPTVLGLIYQDDVGGLEVLNNGEWILVAPIEGALVFHICDVLQVLTNDKLVSPRHRVNLSTMATVDNVPFREMAATRAIHGGGRAEIYHNHPLYLHLSDTPGAVLVGIQLKVMENYSQWSRAIKVDHHGSRLPFLLDYIACQFAQIDLAMLYIARQEFLCICFKLCLRTCFKINALLYSFSLTISYEDSLCWIISPIDLPNGSCIALHSRISSL